MKRKKQLLFALDEPSKSKPKKKGKVSFVVDEVVPPKRKRLPLAVGIKEALRKFGITAPDEATEAEKAELLSSAFELQLDELNIKELETDCLGLYYDPRDTACRQCQDRRDCLKLFASNMRRWGAENVDQEYIDTEALITAAKELPQDALDAILGRAVKKRGKPSKAKRGGKKIIPAFDAVQRIKIFPRDGRDNPATLGSFTANLIEALWDSPAIITLGELCKSVLDVSGTMQAKLTVDEAVEVVRDFTSLYAGVLIEFLAEGEDE